MSTTEQDTRWLLPDGVEELLPEAAEHVERVRGAFLRILKEWGYRLVVPPMLEYLDSLLTGFGGDLELQTLKVTDQLSGRLMGLRADMTSQVARIDAREDGQGIRRLCYAGSVLHARPDGPTRTRCPLMVGAELFGHEGPAADAEVITLLASLLHEVGMTGFHIELGHAGIIPALMAAGKPLPEVAQRRLLEAVTRKSATDVAQALEGAGCDATEAARWRMLPELMGDASVLGRAVEAFQTWPPAAQGALAELIAVYERLQRLEPSLPLRVDLSELRGYNYHTGVTFAVYAQGFGAAVARGGRYDGIGAAFGRARAATGFDVDVKLLTDVHEEPSLRSVIGAPDPDEVIGSEAALLPAAVAALRGTGEVVVSQLGSGDLPPDCDRLLAWHDGRWQVRAR